MERRVINSHVESEIHSRLSLMRIAEKKTISEMIRNSMKKLTKASNHEKLINKVRERTIIEFSVLSIDDKKLSWKEYMSAKQEELLDKGICISDINEIFNFEYEKRQ